MTEVQKKLEFFSELDELYRKEKDLVDSRLISIIRLLPFLIGGTAYLFNQKMVSFSCCEGSVSYYWVFLIINMVILAALVLSSTYAFVSPTKVSYLGDVTELDKYWATLNQLAKENVDYADEYDFHEKILSRIIENAAFNENSYKIFVKRVSLVRWCLLGLVLSYLPLLTILVAKL